MVLPNKRNAEETKQTSKGPKVVKSCTPQFGPRENPAPLLRQHGSRLAVDQPPTQSRKESVSRSDLKQEAEKAGIERPITCEEAADVLRIHPRTIKRMARRGEVPGHFRFGRWFFYPSELDSWMRTELHSARHSCR